MKGGQKAPVWLWALGSDGCLEGGQDPPIPQTPCIVGGYFCYVLSWLCHFFRERLGFGGGFRAQSWTPATWSSCGEDIYSSVGHGGEDNHIQ